MWSHFYANQISYNFITSRLLCLACWCCGEQKEKSQLWKFPFYVLEMTFSLNSIFDIWLWKSRMISKERNDYNLILCLESETFLRSKHRSTKTAKEGRKKTKLGDDWEFVNISVFNEWKSMRSHYLESPSSQKRMKETTTSNKNYWWAIWAFFYRPSVVSSRRFSILMNVRWASTCKSIASISIRWATRSDAKTERSWTVKAITFEAHS